MISYYIANPKVVWSSGRWLVLHPSNDAILADASSDTEAREAARVITQAISREPNVTKEWGMFEAVELHTSGLITTPEREVLIEAAAILKRVSEGG